MGAKNPAVFIDPLDVSNWTNPPGGTDPGFTRDLMDILGDQAGPSDGFDELVAGTGQLLTALDTVLGEQDAALDTILAQHGASDTTPLANTINNYVGSFDAGNSVVAGMAAGSAPFMGVLPISTNPLTAGIPQAPALVSLDLGTVKLGAAPLVHAIGMGEQSGNDFHGASDVNVVANTGMDIIVDMVERDSVSGAVQRYYYSLIVAPSAVGRWTAEVTWLNTVQPVQTNLTLTINVVP